MAYHALPGTLKEKRNEYLRPGHLMGSYIAFGSFRLAFVVALLGGGRPEGLERAARAERLAEQQLRGSHPRQLSHMQLRAGQLA